MPGRVVRTGCCGWWPRAGSSPRSTPGGSPRPRWATCCAPTPRPATSAWSSESCPTGTTSVLVVEAVIPPGDDPHYGKLTDLLMMSSLPGRERTRAEFEDLLARAGFRLTRVLPTASRLSIVEGVPADR
ncbi:methyltransferase [Actinosynnema sp. NPDC023587]|uniref:methyltransferase n=1 Tax=Actinosynnema sp. NPDC023587 TaxID=3154695 RepID=UPI0033DA1564